MGAIVINKINDIFLNRHSLPEPVGLINAKRLTCFSQWTQKGPLFNLPLPSLKKSYQIYEPFPKFKGTAANCPVPPPCRKRTL